jgi:subtilase family serine protease
MTRYRKSGLSVTLRLVVGLALIAQPLLADRPPDGYARPPIHVGKGGFAATTPTGFSPAQLRHAYGVDVLKNQGAGQTIAIVDAYDDPNIASDLNTFVTYYGLPACNFQKIYASGRQPRSNSGWALEIALDVEWSCAMAPAAKIILVEAASSSYTNLLNAVDVAVLKGATVVSMSWGGGESSGESSYDTHFAVNGVTFTASSGDSGNGVEYPAASPDVVSVGGTTLTLSGGTYGGETAWSGSGGGLSAYENEPLYQATYRIYGIPNDPSGKGGVPDVAFDADPNTGVAVYDSVSYNGQSGWFQVGGTSVGSPCWAGLFAIANSLRVAVGETTLSSSGNAAYVYTAAAAASYATNFHDVTSGTNGSCGTLCTALTGYDYVTGLGSPQANYLLPALASYK